MSNRTEWVENDVLGLEPAKSDVVGVQRSMVVVHLESSKVLKSHTPKRRMEPTDDFSRGVPLKSPSSQGEDLVGASAVVGNRPQLESWADPRVSEGMRREGLPSLNTHTTPESPETPRPFCFSFGGNLGDWSTR